MSSESISKVVESVSEPVLEAITEIVPTKKETPKWLPFVGFAAVILFVLYKLGVKNGDKNTGTAKTGGTSETAGKTDTRQWPSF